MNIWCWIALIVALQGIIFMLLVPLVIYNVLFRRTKPTKWARTCSMPEDPEYVRMYEQGLAWGERYRDRIEEVSIQNDGLKLCGRFIDFGQPKTVIIIPGRTEAGEYSYYFAEPYRRLGCNIMAIDNRSHGLSEGKVASLGFREYRDILAWGRYLHEERGSTQILLHGICIGSSTGLFALTAPDCPDYFRGMTADGMYTAFYHSFKNHMLEDKRPLFPTLQLTMLYIRIFSGANVVTDGPRRRMPWLKKPILFLHGREDIYSTPDQVKELYNICTSEKKLVWFEKGAHSRLRMNQPEEYDQAVVDFWREKC
ncbi:MAG: alpha/beta hydrolase [Ruminococcaceae bacterium]|nr:alpha/beta hydrolase [Oscillospiraceae bacterium]